MEKDRKLIRLNALEQNQAGVYVNASAPSLAYCDGDEAEQYLLEVIRQARDVSSLSLELQEKIRDWSSKYHLCASRANLLRGLSLQSGARALELGAGCGAITRYLGEAGLRVDAVEGSARRAEIARMRCRDLANVLVVQGNFNDLQLPEAEYEYIFLIGVLEYAAMFQDAASDEEALRALLQRVEAALRPGGVVCMALENRMGLKYWLGCNEDHYDRPFVGLYDYPLDKGIRTYDRERLTSLITAGTLKACRYLYPFPDYKLPRLLLTEQFIRQDRYASSLLYRLSSQDYQGSMSMECSELLLWDGLQKNNLLEDFANSFLILLGESASSVNAPVENDFTYFSGSDRAPAYRTITAKPTGKEQVVKKLLTGGEAADSNDSLRHVLTREEYVSGPLLSVRWLQILARDPAGDLLAKQVECYWNFLKKQMLLKGSPSAGNFDLLPFNIVLDTKEQWQIIDKEWQVTEPVAPEFVLFRALLFFVVDNQPLFRTFARRYDCGCVFDLIAWFFKYLGLDLQRDQQSFLQKQADIVRHIVTDAVPEQALVNSLYQPLSFQVRKTVPELETVELYWAETADGFGEDRKLSCRVGADIKTQLCRFLLPHVSGSDRYLRIDPGTQPGFFTLKRLALFAVPGDGDKQLLWEVKGTAAIVAAARLQGVDFLAGQFGSTLVAVEQDPHLIFDIGPNCFAGLQSGSGLYCEVELSLPVSPDMILARQALEHTVNLYQRKIRTLRERFAEQQQLLDKRNNTILLYQDELKQYEIRHRELQESFTEMVNSPVRRCGERLRTLWRLRRKLKKLSGRIRYLRNADYRLIERSGLFDRAWYLSQYPDIGAAGADPLVHYLESGWQELRDPNPLFSTSFYIGQYKDVRAAKVNPLLHYVQTGSGEGRDPHPVFHGRYYMEQVGTASLTGETPLAHFLQNGHKAEADPNPLFDSRYYLRHNPDVAAAGLNPLVHYQTAGGHEMRDPGPFFSAAYYAAKHPDLQQSDATPLAHYYLRHGTREDWQDISFAPAPKISILTPVYNVDAPYLKNCVGSVRGQSYPNWELCLVDDGSSAEHIHPLLEEFSAADSRIKIKILEQNQGISGATNEAASLATGDYLAFLDNDDELAPHALMEVAKAIHEHDADMYYSDEDIVDADGHVTSTHCKPDYSPDLLLCHNYITHLLVVRRQLFDQVGGLQTSCDGAQDFDLLLRLTEQTDRIVHITKVLYHWRSIETSTAADPDAKGYAVDAGKKALEQALLRRDIQADVLPANRKFYYRVRRAIVGHPLVSIIIPFRDQHEYLRRCVDSILNSTGYQYFEIIGVDNNSEEEQTHALMAELMEVDSRIHFVRYEKPFNYSAINNFAVQEAAGEHIILMNNDIEVLNIDWLEALLEHSQRQEIGAVGAKLYYKNNTIQHAGVIIGIAGFAGHSHRHFPRRSPGYFNRLNCIQNFSAVTAALLMVKKQYYHEVGGLDEENLGTALNDVDFCLKLREKGYLNIFTPYCEAYHYESVSRGYEDTVEKKARFAREVAYFQKRWAVLLAKGDPYYNPQLTLDREDFSLKVS